MKRQVRLAIVAATAILAVYPMSDTASALIIIDGPGNGTAQAVRLNPPPPPPPVVVPVLFSSESANGRCVGAEFLLGYFSPGWDVVRMSKIMYRESRCDPSVARTDSGSTGLLQILRSHCGWLSARMNGEPCNLKDPVWNIRAGAVLWREQGYQAWSQTS